MRVANESLKAAYHESFELYNIEDGHITLDKALPDEIKEKFENGMAMKIYGSFSLMKIPRKRGQQSEYTSSPMS